MEKFQVIQPSALLTPYIKQYWFLTMDDVVHGSQRLIPFGCMVLSFHRRQSYLYLSGNCLLSKSCLSGQTTAYSNLEYSGNVNFISIIFQPAGAMAFFKIPMKELNNLHIDIDILGDTQILELEDQLMYIEDNETCVRLIEAFLFKRLYLNKEYNHRRLTTVIKSINRGQNNITELALTACLSYKQFKRIFTKHIGLNPKDFLRIYRFQRASYISQTQTQLTLTELADKCLYYDKSHFIRECKEFTGYTPTEFRSNCDPYSDYHSLFRSAFLDLPANQI